MAFFSTALVALLVMSFAPAAVATSFTVGDSDGWATDVDYPAWASGKTFAVGDTLVFKYARKAHTVARVTKSGYDSCSATNSLSYDDSGSTTVTFTIPGVYYFICTVPGHCASGMKLVITVTVDPGEPSGNASPAGTVSGGCFLVPAKSSIIAAGVGTLVKLALF